MAEIPIPSGYGVPLVDLDTKRLPEPTMEVLLEDATLATKVIRDAAAGSAASAAASRTSAASSAAAATSSADTAAQERLAAESAAGVATAARNGAEGALSGAQAAYQGADSAAGAALNFQNAAEAAKADAETARAGAEGAQAGAETARLASEAAANVSLAGQFAGTVVANTGLDFNTLVTPGVYGFSTAAMAASLNAPATRGAGVLRQYRVANGYVLQVVTANASPNIEFRRTGNPSTNTGWAPWRAVASQKITTYADQPGVDLTLWDDVNNREQQVVTSNVAIGTVHLNNVIQPGIYRQSSPASITLEQGYPLAGSYGRGILEVMPWGGTSQAVVQRYTTIGVGTTVLGRLTFLRRREGDIWSPWSAVPYQRVDQTAGRAIYTWDDVNVREQLVYGDTGWRILAPDPSIVTAGSVRVRRIDSLLFVRIAGGTVVTTPPEGAVAVVLPSGMKPDGAMRTQVLLNSASAMVRFTGDGGSLRLPAGTYAAGESVDVPPIALTSPWPTTLPGTAAGSIPNV